jgi:amidase
VVFRRKAAARIAEIVGKDRVIVLPTMPDAAPLLASREEDFENFRGRAVSMLCMAGHSGLPQISLPLMTVRGAPLGISLIGPAGRDRALIALAGKILAA